MSVAAIFTIEYRAQAVQVRNAEPTLICSPEVSFAISRHSATYRYRDDFGGGVQSGTIPVRHPPSRVRRFRKPGSISQNLVRSRCSRAHRRLAPYAHEKTSPLRSTPEQAAVALRITHDIVTHPDALLLRGLGYLTLERSTPVAAIALIVSVIVTLIGDLHRSPAGTAGVLRFVQ